MRVTAEERRFLAMHRERIRLDSIDWTKQPYVADLNLLEMSPGVAYRVAADPLFVRCHSRCMYINMRNDIGANDV